jgi:serine/threonine protein kinase
MNLASLPGAVLDGKYRIERQLGKGGMGAVFQAIHLGTTRIVAVKVIVPQLAAQDEFLFRFQREAEAAGRLRHPNVVNVTDFGSAIAGNGQLAYLVMEFLDGENLSEFLRRNPRPAADEILDIVDQVALALDAAHASGIVHRDLKPDNIWLQPNHRGGFNVKVLDFGIAKVQSPVGMGSAEVVPKPSLGFAAVSPASKLETLAMAPAAAPTSEAETIVTYASLRPPTPSAAGSLRLTNATTLETTVGSVLGTPAYMAPEQCQGTNVEASADIYSLSVIVYQMFCGCLPFEAKSLTALLQKQIEELPTPPAERDPGISKRVSAAIMRGLAKLPAERPASATEFAAQLRAGSEAELKLLANGKIVANNHGNCFFPLLLACFAPYVPTMAALYLALRALSAAAVIPPFVAAVLFQALLFVVQFFLSQMYKAGSTLLLNEAAAAGHFRREWRPQFLKLVRALRPLLATHLRNAFDFRPRSFLSGQLWPVVWAFEGLSGKPALARAVRLGRAEPAATAALAARQWGILSITTLFVPALFAPTAGGLNLYARFVTGPSNAIAWFAVFYPAFLSLMGFRFFGPAFFFLYLSARRCLGEAVEFSLPSARREQRSRRARTFRPATIVWLSAPALMAVFLLCRAVVRGESSRDLLDAVSEGRKTAALRMLDSGLPVDASDRRGWTPLMFAIASGDLEFARELVARHANVNAQNLDGDTPLLLALWNRRSAEAEMLIASGANVQTANQDGRTALFAAAMHGDSAICTLLLARGADRSHRDSQGKTALDYAKQEGASEVAALLSAAMPPSPASETMR